MPGFGDGKKSSEETVVLVKYSLQKVLIPHFQIWNEKKYILFSKIYINLQHFQVISENKTQRKFINYLIFIIKKIKKAKLWRNILDG